VERYRVVGCLVITIRQDLEIGILGMVGVSLVISCQGLKQVGEELETLEDILSDFDCKENYGSRALMPCVAIILADYHVVSVYTG
jgi:hypothetical protein